MLLKAGEGVVAAAAGVVGARVHRLAGVVHLLVVLEMVLATEGSTANITGECFSLGVDEDVSLQLELGGELLIASYR